MLRHDFSTYFKGKIAGYDDKLMYKEMIVSEEFVKRLARRASKLNLMSNSVNVTFSMKRFRLRSTLTSSERSAKIMAVAYTAS